MGGTGLEPVTPSLSSEGAVRCRGHPIRFAVPNREPLPPLEASREFLGFPDDSAGVGHWSAVYAHCPLALVAVPLCSRSATERIRPARPTMVALAAPGRDGWE